MGMSKGFPGRPVESGQMRLSQPGRRIRVHLASEEYHRAEQMTKVGVLRSETISPRPVTFLQNAVFEVHRAPTRRI